MLWVNSAHAQLLKRTCSRAQGPEKEKPQQWEAHTPQPEISPALTTTRESLQAKKKERKPAGNKEDPVQPKNKEKIFLNTSLSVYKQNDTIPEIYFKILQQKKGINRTRKAEYWQLLKPGT